MNKIDEIQQELIQDFQTLGDGFEQYAYLIELSALLPPLPEDKKTDEAAVKGCQSHVWLDMKAEDGAFYVDADSDTFILKGILYLLRRMFQGQPLSDVANAKITLFTQTELMQTFENDRQKGIGYIIRTMQDFAAGTLCKTQ